MKEPKKLPISLHPHPHSPAPTEANGGDTLPSVFAIVPPPNPNTTYLRRFVEKVKASNLTSNHPQ